MFTLFFCISDAHFHYIDHILDVFLLFLLWYRPFAFSLTRLHSYDVNYRIYLFFIEFFLLKFLLDIFFVLLMDCLFMDFMMITVFWLHVFILMM